MENERKIVFEQGARAAAHGQAIDGNPHADGTLFNDAWRAGWLQETTRRRTDFRTKKNAMGAIVKRPKGRQRKERP